MSARIECCGMCRFARYDDDVTQIGRCHRNPPVVLGYRLSDDAEVGGGFWPLIKSDDWCGEYQPPPKEPS